MGQHCRFWWLKAHVTVTLSIIYGVDISWVRGIFMDLHHAFWVCACLRVLFSDFKGEAGEKPPKMGVLLSSHVLMWRVPEPEWIVCAKG